MNKRGLEMSMSVIMTAVLAIIVLIVLILIFTGRMQPLVRTSDDCLQIPGGECVEFDKCDYPGEFSCGNEELVCCINLCKGEGGGCGEECIGEGCKNKCPEGTKRLYLSGCGEGQVCCKEEEE